MQHLIYMKRVPKAKRFGRLVLSVHEDIDLTKLKRLWVVSGFRNKAKKPELPFKPRHFYNAFLEDRGHDYNVLDKNRLSYSGTMRSDGGSWFLLEMEE